MLLHVVKQIYEHAAVADPVKFWKLLKSHFLVKVLTFVDFCVFFLGVLIFGWLL